VTLDSYQTALLSVSLHYPKQSLESDLFLGLAAETGELLAELEKSHRLNQPLSLDALTLELGDTLAYLSLICSFYDISLSSIATLNLSKLQARRANP
jgi:NTP pyrophosphatase (non-canonical NTP hydrolase)